MGDAGIIHSRRATRGYGFGGRREGVSVGGFDRPSRKGELECWSMLRGSLLSEDALTRPWAYWSTLSVSTAWITLLSSDGPDVSGPYCDIKSS